MKNEIVKFQTIKTVKEPIVIKFKTRNGKTVSFNAVKTVVAKETKKPNVT